MSSSVSGGVTPLVYASALALELPAFRRAPEAETIDDETRLCYRAIESQLASRGLTLNDVVKVNGYLSDESYRDEFVTANRSVFSPGPYPVGTTVVLGLAGDARVQVEVIAVEQG